jgi:hypothetical protein
MNIFPLLASASDLGISAPTKGSRIVASNLVLILTVALLIAGVFIAYIVFIRGSKSEIQIPSRRIHEDEDEEGSSSSSSEKGEGRRRKKKRTRRREHRHRNPTLSQTGGLPPSRDSEQSPSTEI